LVWFNILAGVEASIDGPRRCSGFAEACRGGNCGGRKLPPDCCDLPSQRGERGKVVAGSSIDGFAIALPNGANTGDIDATKPQSGGMKTRGNSSCDERRSCFGGAGHMASSIFSAAATKNGEHRCENDFPLATRYLSAKYPGPIPSKPLTIFA
jgi:hypothetical protein